MVGINPAPVSTGGTAELDLEQATPQTILAAWRTDPPAKSTYSAVSEFTPYPQVGGGDTPSDLQVETAGALKPLFSKSIECCKHLGDEYPIFGRI